MVIELKSEPVTKAIVALTKQAPLLPKLKEDHLTK